MPKLTDNLENFKMPGSYGYSATKLTDLASTEYTLITLACDDSSSVGSFLPDMVKAIKEVILACRHSPRADYLMIRVVTFSNSLNEFHGFKLLSNCNVDDYDKFLGKGGMTALFDATINSVDATSAYGKTLVDSDFSTNAVVFIITDGCDNASSNSVAGVSESLKKAMANESLESLVSILIGVNVSDSGVLASLNDLHTQGGFTQFVHLADASSKSLARLAQFVSKSISSQSTALGSNGPSKSLTI